MTQNILDVEDNTDVKNYLELMPENQRDPEALAKKAYHGDLHIKMLERRMDELRDDFLKEREANQTGRKLEDLVKMLENKQLASNEQPPVKEVIEKPVLDLDEFDKRLEQKIAQREQAMKQEQNANLVRSKLKERFGDNYAVAVKEQIKNLDLTEDDFNALARRSPTALLKSLGVEEGRRDSYEPAPRSSGTFKPQGPKKRTWASYQEMKKADPKLYHDPKTLIQMEKDAMELGDEFYDGDFNRL